MGYSAQKDLPRRTAFNKVLCNKAFATANNLQHDGFQRGHASTIYKFFDNLSKDTTTHTGTRIISEYQQLANDRQVH